MTATTNFDDDADTVSGCTGECCDPVTLPVARYREVSRDPRHVRNARYIMNMLTPRGPLPHEGTAEFDCRHFDRETRRCTTYDRRPKMCRDFPETGVCRFCGSKFDARAEPAASEPRGVESPGARFALLRSLTSQTSSRPSEPSHGHEEP